MFLDSGGFANAIQDGIRQGGAFELKQLTWTYRAAMESPAVLKNPVCLKALKSVDIAGWFAGMPWKRGHSPLSAAPEHESYVYDQWEQGNFDGFWKQLGFYAAGFYGQFSDAPMTFMSAWYDPYPRSATDNYTALSKLRRGPVRLILGPWTHGDRTLTYAISAKGRASSARASPEQLSALRREPQHGRARRRRARCADCPQRRVPASGPTLAPDTAHRAAAGMRWARGWRGRRARVRHAGERRR